jgi:hypothetical protein
MWVRADVFEPGDLCSRVATPTSKPGEPPPSTYRVQHPRKQRGSAESTSRLVFSERRSSGRSRTCASARAGYAARVRGALHFLPEPLFLRAASLILGFPQYHTEPPAGSPDPRCICRESLLPSFHPHGRRVCGTRRYFREHPGDVGLFGTEVEAQGNDGFGRLGGRRRKLLDCTCRKLLFTDRGSEPHVIAVL